MSKIPKLAADAAREWRDENVAAAEPIRILPPGAEKPLPKVELVRGSTIRPESVRWLWPGWLAAGKMHILGGAPGTGKTTIAIAFAATVSSGGLWPDGTRAEAGHVVIWSGEDDPKDTLAPRLIAAGADMSRVYFVGGVLENGKPRTFDISKDVDPMAAAIRGAGGASLLIVDPIVSAVAGDSHKNAETRRALQPLVELASSVEAALLGITHFSKGTANREPTERITGSLAFGALARVVMVAAKAPGEGEEEAAKRVLMRSKSNIGPDEGGFAYELCMVELHSHPGLAASRVEWGGHVEGRAIDVLCEAEVGPKPAGGAVGVASAFLRSLLAEGPVAVSEIRVAANGSDISWPTVRRAKEALGVVSLKSGFGKAGEWEWALPGLRCSGNAKGAQEIKVGTLGKFEHLSGPDDMELEI